MTHTVAVRSQAEESADHLRTIYPQGSTVYLCLRHVSRSGMMRHISPVQITTDGVRDWSWHVANVLDWKLAKGRSGVQVGGCGMDMGFHMVYELAQTLYGDGYALKSVWI